MKPKSAVSDSTAEFGYYEKYVVDGIAGIRGGLRHIGHKLDFDMYES